MRTSPEDYQPSRCAGLLPTEVAKLIEESRAPLLAALDKAESALDRFTGVQHEGDCVYTDKSDEGCYLCRAAASEQYKLGKEALAAIRKVKGQQ